MLGTHVLVRVVVSLSIYLKVMVVSIVHSIQNDADPAVMTTNNSESFNQTYTVKATDIMRPYDIWVTIDNRDVHLVIQAKDSLQARAIAEQLYGVCYGVTGPLNE